MVDLPVSRVKPGKEANQRRTVYHGLNDTYMCRAIILKNIDVTLLSVLIIVCIALILRRVFLFFVFFLHNKKNSKCSRRNNA